MTATEMFLRSTFVQGLGIELLRIENGICETKLHIRPDHLQQDGFAHAGVITTLADHSCGGAAGSLLKPKEHVLTAEFKTTFVRAAKGPELFCRARCFKRGRSLAFTEASVYSTANYEEDTLIATMSSTLAIRLIEE